ncbi:hypothetical protein [Rossellomorea marisflavi]|uniref:hypothetical protein n=1 Tax=Rossellomorea marisflavi TaxID=189381 RepID=UPI001EE285AF|nr:hypothetical protein [Rossellomorea marisflavi]
MKRYNLIVILNEAMDRVLLCKWRKEPYQGLSNFIGGKIEGVKQVRLQPSGKWRRNRD